MTCRMFTLHGHGTWMPDHPKGYVHRQHGVQPSDEHMAAHYRFRQTGEVVRFDAAAMGLMIETAREASGHVDAVTHGVAVEATHVHVLMSWRHDRDERSMRTSVRTALSRALNSRIARHDPEGWFADSPWISGVEDLEHFDYLMLEYLPGHGMFWLREEDRAAAERRDAQRSTSVRARTRA